MGNPGTRRRRIGIWIVSGAVALALTPAAAPHINNNFHTLVEGEAYRSAQPSPEEIRSYFVQHKIATILNLRGPSPGSPWYDDELRTAKELGITHIDLGMSARRELTPQQVLQLVSTMKSAPKPLLIHCKAGADRTGLASALYLAEIAGQKRGGIRKPALAPLWPLCHPGHWNLGDGPNVGGGGTLYRFPEILG